MTKEYIKLLIYYTNNWIITSYYIGHNNNGDKMKKYFFLLIAIVFPLKVLAYSDYVYLGGKTLGIEVNCYSPLIVGFYQINGSYNKGELKVGDYITKINGNPIMTLKELTEEIEKYTDIGYVNITYKRNNKEHETKLKLIKDNKIYKTGLYVKDSILGIGTLTYIDPESNIYGALGHEIIESNTNKKVEIKDGSVFRNTIVSIDKSMIGHAGSKNAKYYYNTQYGSINKNTNLGIFGNWNSNYNDLTLIKVGNINNVKVGEASIWTVLDGEKIEEYKIDITSINENGLTKNITFEITDKRLLNKTGGIVQGMSGSPIVQDNSIIGVVTHVIIDNPIKGYGLFITNMLQEGDN